MVCVCLFVYLWFIVVECCCLHLPWDFLGFQEAPHPLCYLIWKNFELQWCQLYLRYFDGLVSVVTFGFYNLFLGSTEEPFHTVDKHTHKKAWFLVQWECSSCRLALVPAKETEKKRLEIVGKDKTLSCVSSFNRNRPAFHENSDYKWYKDYRSLPEEWSTFLMLSRERSHSILGHIFGMSLSSSSRPNRAFSKTLQNKMQYSWEHCHFLDRALFFVRWTGSSFIY